MVTTARSPAAWTGDELLMWPTGTSRSVHAYDPDTETWRELADAPIAPRERAASVWSGSEWNIWGGISTETEDRTAVADGAAYNPVTDTWRVIAESPLSARRAPAVWTGTEMIVAAGAGGAVPVTGNGEMALSDGAAYDPVSDTWRSISSRHAHRASSPYGRGPRW